MEVRSKESARCVGSLSTCIVEVVERSHHKWGAGGRGWTVGRGKSAGVKRRVMSAEEAACTPRHFRKGATQVY